MILRQLETLAFSYNEFVWWMGKVEDIDDKTKSGRVQVRIYGYYDDVEKEQLPWALCLSPTISASIDGVGYSTNIGQGSTVMGFFADGHDALTPIILGTLGSNPTGGRGRYSSGESDGNRLSRGETSGTIVPKKQASRDTGIQLAFSGYTWDEPEVPFAAKYPNNAVFETKCGHVQEFDSTGGAERIHTYHSKGSFEEYHPSGDKVEKVIRDKYTITAGDDFCHIKGDSVVTIDGNCKVLILGNSCVEVKGNKNELIHGDYNLVVKGKKKELIRSRCEFGVEGRMSFKVGGNFMMDVCGNYDLAASQVFVSPDIIIKGDTPYCTMESPFLSTGSVC
jgi:hypothetical protein